MEIEELPTLAIDAILGYLPFHERFRLRRISKGWRRVVEPALGRVPVPVFNPFGEAFLTLPWTKTSQESERLRAKALKSILTLCGPAVQTLRIRRVQDYTPLTKKEFYNLKNVVWEQLRRCSGAKRLEIEGECITDVRPSYFDWVLGSLENLETIVLTGFFKSQSVQRLNQIRLPRLREVWLNGMSSSQFCPEASTPVQSVRLFAKASPKFLRNLQQYGERLRSFELVHTNFDQGPTQARLVRMLSTLFSHLLRLKHLKLEFSDKSAFGGVRGMNALTACLTAHLSKLKDLITFQMQHDYATFYSSCGNAPSNISNVHLPGNVDMLASLGTLPHLQALCLGNMESGIFRQAERTGCGKAAFPALTRLGLVGWAYDIPEAIAYFRPVAERIEQISLEDSELELFSPGQLLASWTALDHVNVSGARLLTGPHQIGNEERHTTPHCKNLACSPRRKAVSLEDVREFLVEWRANRAGKRILRLAVDRSTFDLLRGEWESFAMLGLYLRHMIKRGPTRRVLFVITAAY